MKSLSVRQPYAELIARGVKSLEIRSWKTDYRGPLLICASSGPPQWDDSGEQFGLLDADCPRGVAVCVVQLVGCERMTRQLEKIRARIDAAACCSVDIGDYMFMFERPQRVKRFSVKGRLRLYEVPDRLIRIVDGVPPCAASMGCLCAGHARGNPADVACDTRE